MTVLLLPPLLAAGSSAAAAFLGAPSSTWAARDAKLSDDSVSPEEPGSGDRQHTSATLDAPHSESCSTCMHACRGGHRSISAAQRVLQHLRMRPERLGAACQSLLAHVLCSKPSFLIRVRAAVVNGMRHDGAFCTLPSHCSTAACGIICI